MGESFDKPLKVICFGMGAIGTYIGGSLAAVGAEVTYIEKPEYVAESNYREIRLQISKDKVLHPWVNICTSMEEALAGTPADVALIAVKSNDTQSVLDSIKGVESRFPSVLCLQNGVENEDLLISKLGKERVIAGSITSAVGKSGLGDIRLEKLRGVGIETGHLVSEALIDWFDRAGLNAKGYSSRADMKWSKMLTNLMANATSAILNWTPQQVYSNPLTWQIEMHQLKEAMAVMNALHIRVVNLPGTPVVPLMFLLKNLPASLSRILVGSPLAKGRGGKMPSFHIDLYSGKTSSEVTYLNGAVSRFASQAGLKAPVNERLCDLLEKMAAGQISKEEYADQPQKLLRWIETGL